MGKFNPTGCGVWGRLVVLGLEADLTWCSTKATKWGEKCGKPGELMWCFGPKALVGVVWVYDPGESFGLWQGILGP